MVEQSNALVYLITSQLELKVEGSNTGGCIFFANLQIIWLCGDKKEPRLSYLIKVYILGGRGDMGVGFPRYAHVVCVHIRMRRSMKKGIIRGSFAYECDTWLYKLCGNQAIVI